MAHHTYKRQKTRLLSRSTRLSWTFRRYVLLIHKKQRLRAHCARSRDDPRFRAVLDDRFLIYGDSSRAKDTVMLKERGKEKHLSSKDENFVVVRIETRERKRETKARKQKLKVAENEWLNDVLSFGKRSSDYWTINWSNKIFF